MCVYVCVCVCIYIYGCMYESVCVCVCVCGWVAKEGILSSSSLTSVRVSRETPLTT